MIPYVELNSQFRAIEKEVRAAIDEVLESGWYILGKQGIAFEGEFARYLSANHCVGCASGTEAIQLALLALGIGPGDEVITAANTCVPTVCGIAGSGASIRLADVDPQTCTVTAETIAAKLTPKTRAIVPVHLYGHPCDMGPIMSLAKEKGIRVVEDCAQAHGAVYNGTKCGTIGDAAAFSFYPSKNLGAYGDGGAIVTNDEAAAKRLRMLRNYGEERRYHHTIPGINSRLDEIQAAILRVKLRHLDAWNEARRERAAQYDSRLKGVQRPVEAAWARHIYHLYVVRTSQRDALQSHLRDREIGTFIHYPVPVHLQPAYAGLGYSRGAFPNAESACDTVLSLPMYPELPIVSVDQVAEAVTEFFA
jgi:dTDP-4-amino-4,6-dideoxygalactose transaminase